MNEADGVANVTVGVSGQLMREVAVELSFSDGTAISKFYIRIHLSSTQLVTFYLMQ